MNYSIKKALACKRYDLIVNGATIASRDTLRELNSDIVYPWILKGLLLDEE
jgi:hypothetical protein